MLIAMEQTGVFVQSKDGLDKAETHLDDKDVEIAALTEKNTLLRTNLAMNGKLFSPLMQFEVQKMKARIVEETAGFREDSRQTRESRQAVGI